MSPWVETWGFDLRSAEGYQAWREAGGMWPDETETPERMSEYCEAQEVSEQIDAELDIEEAGDEEAA